MSSTPESRQSTRPGQSRERGAVGIEFLGASVILLAAGLIAVQLMLAMQALTQANTAARNGARAEAIAMGTGTPAAYAAVSESLRSGTRAHCSGMKNITCTVQVDMPYLGVNWISQVIPPVTVTRTAHFVRTEPI